MERVILARHAQSVFNVRGVLNGDPSIPVGSPTKVAPRPAGWASGCATSGSTSA